MAKFMVFIAMLITTILSAQENVSTQKIYVDAGQLYIDQEGIFVKYEGDVFQIPAIFHDAKGIYFEAQGGAYCELGHRSYKGDGKCDKTDCPFFRGLWAYR